MKTFQTVELSLEELEAVVGRVDRDELAEGDAAIIRAAVGTIKLLYAVLEEKNISIKRLKRIIFGAKTEKTKTVLKDQQDGQNSGSESEEKGAGDEPAVAENAIASVRDQVGKEQQSEQAAQEKKKPKGHGRNGAKDYRGAERVIVCHPTLKPGDRCPECPKGRLYDTDRPAVIIRLVGRSPVQATVYELQRLRCSPCGKLFCAELPEGCGDEKYDRSVGSIIALLKYGGGFPFNRLAKLQKNFGVPLPPSTQWDLVDTRVNRIYPAYDELVRQAAQGEIIHNDDTPAKIVELMKENQDIRQQDSGSDSRTGMFTTGILSKCGDQKIALFFTGRNHAGENIGRVLQHRDEDRSPPIQMCDALSRNVPKDFAVILANCLLHARRNFVDVAEIFPQECSYVLEILKKVYRNDAQAKLRQMPYEQRLHFHQTESGPLMEELKQWLQDQNQPPTFEPNSSMGQATSYMRDHWEPLTLFLRRPGAPLDNTICERVLKKAVLHRKNSLLYKTLHGAYVGDVFMSIIHTCELASMNAFEYLNTLEEHSSELFRQPEAWLPWNYHLQLTAASNQPA